MPSKIGMDYIGMAALRQVLLKLYLIVYLDLDQVLVEITCAEPF